jgi:hypothetical protein
MQGKSIETAAARLALLDRETAASPAVSRIEFQPAQ